MRTPYDQLIADQARARDLDPAWVQAIVCQESRGDPWAHRVERHYLDNAIVQREAAAWAKRWQGTPTVLTEVTDRASSWGLGQIMGQTAREHGFEMRYLVALTDPETNVSWMCRLLATWRARALHERHLIAMWNGGPGTRWPLASNSAVAGYLRQLEALRRDSPYREA